MICCFVISRAHFCRHWQPPRLFSSREIHLGIADAFFLLSKSSSAHGAYTIRCFQPLGSNNLHDFVRQTVILYHIPLDKYGWTATVLTDIIINNFNITEYGGLSPNKTILTRATMTRLTWCYYIVIVFPSNEIKTKCPCRNIITQIKKHVKSFTEQ